MDLILSPIEARILGALVEKEATTPEYYPLTLNSLVAACNQKSNRDPVMSLGESDVSRALEGLKTKHLVWQLTSTGSRVPKYEHNVKSALQLAEDELAVICVLLLRGAQTIGEIRTRTERIFAFPGLDEVEKTLRKLIESPNGPLVQELPRQPGQKERRFAHVLSGPPEIAQAGPTTATVEPVPVPDFPSLASRATVLEQEVDSLRTQMQDLEKRFERFAQQFQ